jgi:RNA polymerase sigma factor (sigma-70 family)
MMEFDDQELLARYAGDKSEAAFTELVTRHLNLVYSTARRFASDEHHAQDITQAVFVILARKARSLGPATILSGWLYQTTRLTAANFVRGELRRRHREQEAFMQSTLNESETAAWEQIAPFLDEAMGRLNATDRNAVVMRFFENKTLGKVGESLHLTESATHKRITRALEKLRKLLGQRGVTVSGALLAATVSANSVQAAPAHVGGAVAAGSLAKTVAGGSIPWLVQTTLQQLLWLKLRFAMAGVGLSLVGSGVVFVAQSRHVEHSKNQRQTSSSHVTLRVPARSNAVVPLVTAGPAVIKIKLTGTAGLSYEVAYSADGQAAQTAKGVLPGEVAFSADAYNASITVHGPGEFGYEIYRGDLRQAYSSGPVRNIRQLELEARKGGTGMSSRTKGS